VGDGLEEEDGCMPCSSQIEDRTDWAYCISIGVRPVAAMIFKR